MIRKPLGFLLLTASFLLGITACGKSSIGGSTSNTSADSAQALTNDDLEELQGLVYLPVDPDEVSWRERPLTESEAASAGSKEGASRLVAVLRYEGDNAQKFSTSLAGLGKGEPGTAAVETWYPAELIAKGQTGTEETVKVTKYSADSYAKPPYRKGRLFRVEGIDFYILELFSE